MNTEDPFMSSIEGQRLGRELTLVKASLQVLARAAVACIVGPGRTVGGKRDNLIDALNLPKVQEALGSELPRITRNDSEGKLAALRADFDGLIRHVEELTQDNAYLTRELADARRRVKTDAE